MPRIPTPCRGFAIGVLCTVAGAAIAQVDPGVAEASPYSVGAGVGLQHDDNLFRAPAGQEQGDQRRTVQLFGDTDQRFSRQRLRAHAAVADNRYQTRRELDNLGYRGKLGWEGATEGELSWNLSQETSRQLASYGTVQDPGFRGTNIETIDQTLAGAQLGLMAQWAARLSLSHRHVDHTAAAFELERVRLDAIGFDVKWNPQGPLSASVGPRFTRGRVPLASDGLQRTFRRRDLDFGLHWIATGQSELHARLSVTEQRYDAPGQSDFHGATGQLRWQWTVTGKTRLSAALNRDTGSESVFVAAPGSDQVLRGGGDNSQLSTALSARVDHELTAKISLGLDLQYAQRQLSFSSVQAGGNAVRLSGSDRSALVRLGARYTPTRSTALSCEVGRERRGSSTVLSSAYRANTAACNAQLTLRWY